MDTSLKVNFMCESGKSNLATPIRDLAGHTAPPNYTDSLERPGQQLTFSVGQCGKTMLKWPVTDMKLHGPQGTSGDL